MVNGTFPIEESARRLGHYRWIEMRLFEVLGSWVATVPELEVKLQHGPHSFHHAWHAELWDELLPQRRGVDRQALAAPPNNTMVQFVDALASPRGRAQTIERLVGVYRVLIPHKIAVYTHHLERASPVTDGPAIRSLRLVLQDEREDGRQGELLLRSLLRGEEDVQRAAAHEAWLERLLMTAGGIAGPGTLGPPAGSSQSQAGMGGAGVESLDMGVLGHPPGSTSLGG